MWDENDAKLVLPLGDSAKSSRRLFRGNRADAGIGRTVWKLGIDSAGGPERCGLLEEILTPDEDCRGSLAKSVAKSRLTVRVRRWHGRAHPFASSHRSLTSPSSMRDQLAET